MKPGHSYLTCDWMLGLIEKEVRSATSIPSTKMYIDVIATSIKCKFPIVPMQRNEFNNIKALTTYITKLQPCGFSQACQLVVDITNKEGYYIKKDYDYGDDTANIIKVLSDTREGKVCSGQV